MHHRHVRHSALGVDHSSWQVHGISGTKQIFSSGGVVGAAEFRVFLVSDKHATVGTCPFMSHVVSLWMKMLFPDAWMANKKGAEGITI